MTRTGSLLMSVLTSAMLLTTVAHAEVTFTTLKGIPVQALNQQEMAEVEGKFYSTDLYKGTSYQLDPIYTTTTTKTFVYGEHCAFDMCSVAPAGAGEAWLDAKNRTRMSLDTEARRYLGHRWESIMNDQIRQGRDPEEASEYGLGAAVNLIRRMEDSGVHGVLVRDNVRHHKFAESNGFVMIVKTYGNWTPSLSDQNFMTKDKLFTGDHSLRGWAGWSRTDWHEFSYGR